MEEQIETADNQTSGSNGFNWKRSLITAVFIIITAAVVGGTTWYIMDSNMKKERTSNDKSIQELEKTISELKKPTTTKTTTNATTCPSLNDEDVLITSTLKKVKTGNTNEYHAIKITKNDGTWALTSPIPIVFSATEGYTIPARGGSNYLWQKVNGVWTYVGAGTESGWDQAVQAKYSVIPKTIISDAERVSP